jgi:hypothetical protein
VQTDGGEQATPQHAVNLFTPASFLRSYLGLDATQPMEPADWLSLPTQKLRTITCGAVFHDDVGVQLVRDRLAWYPHDVWLYVLAAGWTRIGQDDHLMGRASTVGDELGAAIIAARLVRDLMRLCFLMERQFAPYPKWFGSAFRQLRCAGQLMADLTGIIHASTAQSREAHLVRVYETMGEMHNALAITNPLPTSVPRFFSRPYATIGLSGFPEALERAVRDSRVLALFDRPVIGSVDQFSDSTDLLESTVWRASLRGLYE